MARGRPLFRGRPQKTLFWPGGPLLRHHVHQTARHNDNLFDVLARKRRFHGGQAGGLDVVLGGIGGHHDLGFHLAVHLHGQLHLVGFGLIGVELPATAAS